MAITLATITLPPDSIWSDEFDWTPFAQSVEIDQDGLLVVETSAPRSGQPVTLALGWITHITLQRLLDLRDAVDQSPVPLSLPGRAPFDVLWNHTKGSPIKATPVTPRPDYTDRMGDDPEDYFDTTLLLLKVD